MEILRAERKIAAGRPSAPVDALVMMAILQKFGIYKTWDHLMEQIDYLEGRGYIRKSLMEMLGKTAVLIDITDRGVQLTEHLFTDDSVIFSD